MIGAESAAFLTIIDASVTLNLAWRAAFFVYKPEHSVSFIEDVIRSCFAASDNSWRGVTLIPLSERNPKQIIPPSRCQQGNTSDGLSEETNTVCARNISAADMQAWSDLQQSEPTSDSPFFRPEFALAVAGVRDDVEVGIVRKAQQPVCFFPFQRRSGMVARPVGGPMSDFHGPIVRRGTKFEAASLIRDCHLVAWHFHDLVTAQHAFEPFRWSQQSAPFIEISAGYDAYCDQRREVGCKTITQTMQKLRKLRREVGDVRFELVTRDHCVLRQLMDWKAEQCRGQGHLDLFSFDWVRRLMHDLLHYDQYDFSGQLAAMYAGGEIQAAFFCLRSRDVLHIWVIAHRPELAKYSPGYQLLAHLVERGSELGIRRIDLGRGSERFKTSFANGAIAVTEGSVDLRPFQRHVSRLWYQVRRGVADLPLNRSMDAPRQFAKRLRDRLLYR